MILSPRIHILFYGCLLWWGLVDLVRAVSGGTSWTTVFLGIAYLAVAGYKLCSGPDSKMPVPAVQCVR